MPIGADTSVRSADSGGSVRRQLDVWHPCPTSSTSLDAMRWCRGGFYRFEADSATRSRTASRAGTCRRCWSVGAPSKHRTVGAVANLAEDVPNRTCVGA